jgi:hypothetical protein
MFAALMYCFVGAGVAVLVVAAAAPLFVDDWTKVVGLIDDIPSCAEVVERMVADAEATIRDRLAAMLQPRPRL